MDISKTKTIISHFYNEEYLLPWWLNHHKNLFDHGILIDYGSDDNSIKIINDICPNWTVVSSKNKEFDARLVDQEVLDYEKNINGWRIALNITEFIVGPIDNIINSTTNNQFLIPQISFFDWNINEYLDPNKKLWEQKIFGVDYKTDFALRRSRSLHSFSNIKYSLGRHFEYYNCEELLIFHYANCISSPKMLERRLQIQRKIPIKDIKLNLGFQHHNYGRGLTKYSVFQYNSSYSDKIKNQSFYIEKIFSKEG